MNFSLTENQKLIAEGIRKFGDQHIRPDMMKWDEEQIFPIELFKKLGAQGYMGVLVPEEYGGSGLSYFEYITVVSEISKICGSIGLSVAAHNSLCTGHIMQFGNEEQKKKYLPKLATAEWIGAWGLTEANTGSDALRMKCTAKKDGNSYILNGSKTWITHGKSGDVAVVLARTGDSLDTHGITSFIIEKGTKGFSAGRKENKLGMRASETTELIFEDCRIPESSIMGNVGDGFVQAMKVLDGGRISLHRLLLVLQKVRTRLLLNMQRSVINSGSPLPASRAFPLSLPIWPQRLKRLNCSPTQQPI